MNKTSYDNRVDIFFFKKKKRLFGNIRPVLSELAAIF